MPLENFAKLSQSQASRNLTNVAELDAWLANISEEKLGAGERAQKARRWVSTVGKNFMRKTGQAWPVESGAAKKLAEAHGWAAKALSSGGELLRLSLAADEEEELKCILDWMRSEQGPAMASDWSRISWPQAHGAHQKWTEELGRAERRHQDDSKALDGCALACAVRGVEELAGWSWVRPQTAEALDREGALMRHCVGSYAKQVEDDELQIWSLRDPEGRPRMTVETIPVEEGEGGVKISQVKAFANRAPKAEQRLAIPALFGHLEEIGLRAVAGSTDLSRAGLAISPEGFGPRSLWCRGSEGDEEQALGLVSRLPKKGGLDQARKLAKTCGELRYKRAMRALGLKAQQMGAEAGDLAHIGVCAEAVGLRLGAGPLKGLVIDKESPEDMAACDAAWKNIVEAPASSARSGQMMELAMFFAEGGMDRHMAALAPTIVATPEIADEKVLGPINQALLDASSPSRIGTGALSARALWTMNKDEGEDALAAARRLAASPASNPSEGLEALAVFGKLGHCEAVKALSIFALSADPSRNAIVQQIENAGFAVQIVNGPGSSDATARIWTPTKEDARDAEELARAEPSGLNPILPIALKMGYASAVAAMSAHVSDKEALAMSLDLINRQIDAAHFGIRPGSSRSELEQLREASLLRGLPLGALAALDAMERLPDESFDGAEHAKTMRASYERWKRMVVEMGEAVKDVAKSQALANEFATGGESREMLETSVAWESLGEKFRESHEDTIRQMASCLRAMLAQAVPRLRAQERSAWGDKAFAPSLRKEASKTMAIFFNNGTTVNQRNALIAALVNLPNRPLGVRESLLQRRGQAPGSENFRPASAIFS